MKGSAAPTASRTAKAVAATVFAAVVLALWLAGSYKLPSYILPGPGDVATPIAIGVVLRPPVPKIRDVVE